MFLKNSTIKIYHYPYNPKSVILDFYFTLHENDKTENH